MNHAAMHVMEEYKDIVLAYGQSDEYSFVFHKTCDLYKRRSAKIMSNVNSLFSSAYCCNWSKWFPDRTLKYPPSFDARVILYPTDDNLKDYLSWRQADVHINNLYNTTFWNLVLKGGRTNREAESELCGTFSADKNEILFSKFNINYNNLPAMYRKGTILLRKRIKVPTSEKPKQLIVPLCRDMIQADFWIEHKEILDKSTPQLYEFSSDNKALINERVEDKDVDVFPELVRKQLEKLSLKKAGYVK